MKLWRKQAMAIGRAGNDGKRPGRQIKRMNQMGDLSNFTPVKTNPLLTALFNRVGLTPSPVIAPAEEVSQ